MPSWICSWFAAAAVMTSFSVAWGEEVLTYEQHIRPIFRAHCFDCHGATAEMQGGLDLRLVRLLQRGGESGPAIVPHQPQQSYLLERLRSGDMPPGEKKVSTAEIDTIERWIAAGAATARPEPDTIGEGLGITPEERSFWSFQPIQRPSVPDLATFAPQARVRTPIDALLLRGLPERSPETGGAPEPGSFPPDADRRVLVLRASFTLTGLPPDPEVLRKWLSDPGEDWYDRMLTELLASPHYGERWARHWLDVAGYSDSDGYSVDDPVR
jgi:mono/diheme cytochrome c family protein